MTPRGRVFTRDAQIMPVMAALPLRLIAREWRLGIKRTRAQGPMLPVLLRSTHAITRFGVLAFCLRCVYNPICKRDSPTGAREGEVIVSSALTPHANLWLEQADRVVLSSWRVRLLDAIEETGSISAAAERMQVQYRCAWEKLEEMEAGLGVRLVERQVGGVHGGGARLTAIGRDYVARFKCFAEGIETLIEQQFNEFFITPRLADALGASGLPKAKWGSQTAMLFQHSGLTF